tara:strand:- start:467 stop:1195 length:729 start_codon:yes stop_codon:yes gene_type:complete
MPYQGKYTPLRDDPYKLSRSKVEFFLNCKRCFYIDRKLGIKRPPGFPFNLNSAVDALLKNEFDYYRSIQKPHPYIEDLGVNAIPFQHKMIEKWRQNFIGITYLHPSSNFHLFGAVDDIWLNQDTRELIVVDYKSTSKVGEVTLDAEWQNGYKRQMDFYQYLLRNNGFKVSSTGYFVYCNGVKNKDRFNEVLNFNVKCIKYEGNDDWVESTIMSIYNLLNGDKVPLESDSCEYCQYINQMKII